MNRVVKAFLAIAVAIIYPSFVFLAVVTFLPDKAADMPKAPDYPRSPSCSRYNYDYNGNSSSKSNYSKDCQQEWADYDRAQLDYREQTNAYNREMAAYNNLRDSRSKQRAELAIGFGIFGLVLIYFIRDITALVIGFTVSSTSILVVATATLANIGEKVKAPVASGLSLLSFIIIVCMIWLVDRVLYPRPAGASQAPAQSDTKKTD